MKLIRWLLQLILIAAVIFFGYHYFTREELHGCISVPLESLSGKTTAITLSQAEINQFMTNLSQGVGQAVNKGDEIWNELGAGKILEATISSHEATASGWSQQLLDKGKYLYCKAVVSQVEKAAESK